MRKIAVYVSFMNDRYRAQLRTAAAEQGFDLDFYDCNRDSAALPGRIGDYEVIYGHPDPAWLKRAARLRWLCSDFAGVEKYLDEAIWPSPDCLLSNSSGAYGPTISEHILMVLLMLLRRMPEYEADLLERRWTLHTPIRSITGSHVVLLGTGDIGSHTARRLKALGAAVTGVCRSGRAAEHAFDAVLPVGELDSVLPRADAVVLALPATAETEAAVLRAEGYLGGVLFMNQAEKQEDRETGRVIGSAGFVAPHMPGAAAHEGRSSEIGYALSPDYWGRGLMSEVAAELLRYGFEELGLDEIWCTHYRENHRSRRVIEKSGFWYAFTENLSDEFYTDRPTCFYFITREMWEKRGK